MNTESKMYHQALTAIQFLDELGGPDALTYIAIMRRLSEECSARAARCWDAHCNAVSFWKGAGFEDWNNGGGNIALRKEIGAGLYILVTAADDCGAPNATHDPVAAGLYASAEQDGQCLGNIIAPNSQALFDAIGRGAWQRGNP